MARLYDEALFAESIPADIRSVMAGAPVIDATPVAHHCLVDDPRPFWNETRDFPPLMPPFEPTFFVSMRAPRFIRAYSEEQLKGIDLELLAADPAEAAAVLPKEMPALVPWRGDVEEWGYLFHVMDARSMRVVQQGRSGPVAVNGVGMFRDEMGISQHEEIRFFVRAFMIARLSKSLRGPLSGKVVHLFTWMLCLNEAGQIPSSSKGLTSMMAELPTDDALAALGRESQGLLNPALLAIGLMQTKMTPLVRKTVPDKVKKARQKKDKKKRRRRGKPKRQIPATRYYVVNIDPFKAAIEAAQEAADQAQGDGHVRHVARHRVMGHWRHFRKERGLFGRPIRESQRKWCHECGSKCFKVWINSYTAGDRKHGSIHKDYNVVRADDSDERKIEEVA